MILTVFDRVKVTDPVPRRHVGKLAGVGFLLTCLLGTGSGNASADDEPMAERMKKYRFETVTTKEGLKFSVPSDMPILNENGLVTPMPFDEYLYIKFKFIEERMQSLEQRIEKMESKILAEFKELKAQVASTAARTDASRQTAS